LSTSTTCRTGSEEPAGWLRPLRPATPPTTATSAISRRGPRRVRRRLGVRCIHLGTTLAREAEACGIRRAAWSAPPGTDFPPFRRRALDESGAAGAGPGGSPGRGVLTVVRQAQRGRVAIVTGGGEGHRPAEHALLLAHHGAKVVVNDLGGSMDGEGNEKGPHRMVVDEIVAMGGEALANTDDIKRLGCARAPHPVRCRHVRRPRHPHQQRRHPPGPHAQQHERGRVGPR